MKYFFITFGCQQNIADSERFAGLLKKQGFTEAKNKETADQIIINTCMVRQMAEDRVYGHVINLGKLKGKNKNLKIILTGCMVGLAYKDKTGKYLDYLKKRMPEVDEFLPIEEIGFDNPVVRKKIDTAYVPISNGCNNFCSYCVVPYSRGKEISRPFAEIIQECRLLKKEGWKNIFLLGQNVNSYGNDLLLNETLKPVPTLFPHLLDEIAKMNFKKIDFMSSNPWDFSDKLIDVIAKNKNITRLIHLPVQSGDDLILKKMNRWYTQKEYLDLIKKIRKKIPTVEFTTDIIIGFPGETNTQFKNTVKLCKKVRFKKAYISRYSPRPFAISTKTYPDDVLPKIKKQRWKKLNELINKPDGKRHI